jgi:hypothetical protein
MIAVAMRDIIALIDAYQQAFSGGYYLAAQGEKYAPNTSVAPIASLMKQIKTAGPKRDDAQRPDLGDSFWADVHRLARKSPEKLVDRVSAIANDNPENTLLALVAETSSTLYRHLDVCYRMERAAERDMRRHGSWQQYAAKCRN